MKTALLITGEYRTFDLAVTTWAHLREVPCDLHFATWEETGLTRQRIEAALTHLPLATTFQYVRACAAEWWTTTHGMPYCG